jgi:hypothetical protein
MRYLTIYRPESGEEGGAPSADHMAKMQQLMEESIADGSLISTEPLTPRAQCARRRFRLPQRRVEGGSDRILQKIPEGSGRWNLRNPPDSGIRAAAKLTASTAFLALRKTTVGARP